MSAINPHRIFWRLLDVGIPFCLVTILITLVYGHMGAEAGGLSLNESYITEYMKIAPHWPWLIVSSFSLALLLSLLAFAFMLRAGRSILIIAGCLLMAATSMAIFFVAYSPVRRVEQPKPSYEWWTPTWWFTSKTSRSPYEHGQADAYSDVHYRATRLAVATGVTAIFLLALGWGGLRSGCNFSRVTILAVIAMSVLFLMGDHLDFRRGLWQRLGFTVMYVWFWLAWHQVRKLMEQARHSGTPVNLNVSCKVPLN